MTADQIKKEALEFVAGTTLIEHDSLLIHDVKVGDPWESWYRCIGLLMLFVDYPEVNPEGLCPDAIAAHLSRIWDEPVV